MECYNPTDSPVQENVSSSLSKGDNLLGKTSDVTNPSVMEFTLDEGKAKEKEETMFKETKGTEAPVANDIAQDDDKKVDDGKEMGDTEEKQMLARTTHQEKAAVSEKMEDCDGEELEEKENNELYEANSKDQAMPNGNKRDEGKEIDGDEELDANVNTDDVAPLNTSNETPVTVTEQSEHGVEMYSTPPSNNELQRDKSGVDSNAEESSLSGDESINKNKGKSLLASPSASPSTATSSVDGVDLENANDVTRNVDGEVVLQETSNEADADKSVTTETETLRKIDSGENEGPESEKQERPFSPAVSDTSGQTDKKVTFSCQDTEAAEFSISEGAQRLKQELEDMRLEEEKQNMLEKEKKKAEVKKLKAKLAKDRAKRNVSVDMNTDLYKKFISSELVKEEVIALKDEQEKQNQQTRQMARDIDKKHGISERRKAGSVDKIIRRLETEAKQQARNDEITRELTREEIQDLHIAFDMFDTKRRG